MNSEDVTIREARLDEWDKIPPLHRDEGEEYMERAMERNKWRFERVRDGKRIVLFAEQRDRVVGAIQLQFSSNNPQIANGTTVAHFDDLVVDPDFRSNGIGKQLLQKGEEVLKERGFTKATLGIRSGPFCVVLQEFYERRGYMFCFKKDDGSLVFLKNL